MKIKFLLILISTSTLSAEITLNSRERTILSYPDDIIATNCSPHNLGNISAISGFDSPSGQKILQFIPFGKKGVVVCSAKTLNHGVVSTKFRLLPGVKNPIVEIALNKKRPEVENLSEFEEFIKGEDTSFPKIEIRGSFKTSLFKYSIIEKRQASTHLYLYKILVSPYDKDKKGFIRLDNKVYSPIVFSHHKDENLKEIPGISNSKKSFLYLMTSKSINLHSFKGFLR